MPISYEPQLVRHDKITLPADGDQRTGASVALAVSQVADNVEVAMDYMAGNGPGIARIRAVDDLVALKALTPSDGDVARIATGASMVGALYVFALGSTIIPDNVMIVDDDAGTGRWLHVAAAVTYIDNGLASLGANGKVPDSQLGRGAANGVASLDANSSAAANGLLLGRVSGVSALKNLSAASAGTIKAMNTDNGSVALYVFLPGSPVGASDDLNNIPSSVLSGYWALVGNVDRGKANGGATLDQDGFVLEEQLRRKWGHVSTDGSGGSTVFGSENFTRNIGTAAVEVTFANAMASADYVVVATSGDPHRLASIGTKTTTGFLVHLWNAVDGVVINPQTAISRFNFIVIG